MTEPESQAARITRICGVENLARWTSRSPKQVYCWSYSKQKGGTDGYIPSHLHQTILAAADAEGIPLKPTDFVQAIEDRSASRSERQAS